MIRGILLAGGASTRFGSQKLMHVLPNGLTIGAQSARNLIEAVGTVLAVVRPGVPQLEVCLHNAGCDVLVTDRALEGIGGSLAAAIEAGSGCTGWIVALADMPYIAQKTIVAVKEALEAGAIIAAPVSPTGRRGHPVGFSAKLAGELLLLSGDEGARSVIGKHQHQLVAIPSDDAGIFADVDSPCDL